MSVPADFILRYHWAAPAVPPPYHYEYTISIGPGLQGIIDYLPDYPNHNPPHWIEPFSIGQAAMGSLASLLESGDIFGTTWKRPASQFVGGEQSWMEVAANGKNVAIPAELDADLAAKIQPVYEGIRALVPRAIWAKLETQRQKYASTHELLENFSVVF